MSRRTTRYINRMPVRRVVPTIDQDVILTPRDIPPRIVEPIPSEYTPGPEALVNAFMPPWKEPGYRSKPIDIETEFVTLPYYVQPYVVLELPIPAGSLAVITGISYEVTCMAQYDFFEFSVLRDGDVMSTWRDMLIDPANPNPAYKFALGGHIRQIPYYGRIDSAQVLRVRVAALGTEPFTKVGSDVLLCAARVCIHGWITELDSSREGKGRIDQNGKLMEFPRHFANGDFDSMRNLYVGIPRSPFPV